MDRVPPSRGGLLDCLLVAPSDPITGKPRAGPLRRLLSPPTGVAYTLARERVPIPTSTGEYRLSPASVGLSALKFALEHAFPLSQKGVSLIHTFFWDVRKFERPWVHESDQSLGQFLSGYARMGGLLRRRITEGYSSYLNSRGCVGVVTWSEWARRGFQEDGVDPERIFVVPLPFETVDDRRPHLGCNVLFLGRDYLRKGGDRMLAAFSRLEGRPGCRLTYVGRVDDPAARRAVRDDPRILHLERPSNRTLLEEVWPTVDVFALPTRADAFAVTVVEAMRRGIPVVTSRLPAIAEVVEDGRSGLLCDPGDGDGFLEGLERLVGDPALRVRMGEGARARAASLFSPERASRSLKEVYLRARGPPGNGT